MINLRVAALIDRGDQLRQGLVARISNLSQTLPKHILKADARPAASNMIERLITEDFMARPPVKGHVKGRGLVGIIVETDAEAAKICRVARGMGTRM